MLLCSTFRHPVIHPRIDNRVMLLWGIFGLFVNVLNEESVQERNRLSALTNVLESVSLVVITQQSFECS